MLFYVKFNDEFFHPLKSNLILFSQHKADMVLLIEILNVFAILENLFLLLKKLHSMEGYLFLSNVFFRSFQYENFGN